MKPKLDTSQLKRLIAQNKTEQVLEQLKAFAPTTNDKKFENKITLLEGRYKQLKDDQIKGLDRKEDDQRRQRNINNNLLMLIDDLDKSATTKSEKADDSKLSATKPPESKPPIQEEKTVVSKPSWTKILGIIAATIAILAGIAQISGYSIKDFFEKKDTATVEQFKRDTKQTTLSSTIDNTKPKPSETSKNEKPADNEVKNTQKPVQKPTNNPKTGTNNTINKDKPPPPDRSNHSTTPKTETKTPSEEKDALPAIEKLQIELKTNKGKSNLIFKEEEEIYIYFKVNTACTIRSIYKLADGSLVLLDNDREINTTETNKWLELGDGFGFEVSAPFGKEELYLLAQNTDFNKLETEQKDGYIYIKEGLPSSLRKSRGVKKKQAFAETKLNITTQKK